MQIGNPAYNALNGVRTGMEGLARNAADIASANVTQPNEATNQVTDALVDQTMNANQTKASLKSLTTADGMIGTLIDLHA